MRRALAAIVVLGLLAPATAVAAGRVEPLPAVRGNLWTSGSDLVWESPHHFVRVADARRRVRLKIGLDRHCELQSVDHFVYTNRRTGEQQTGDSYEDPGNLDAPDLRWGPQVRARDHALWLSGKRLARCHPRCVSAVLHRGRLAYFDHGRLIQRTLRSGRVRRWPLTSRMAAGRVLPVGSNLVVARGSFSRRWRLWRAVPY